MRQVILIIHNVRSAHNVGSLLRTADGLGVSQVILSGYTPYPKTSDDPRLPHLAQKISNRIHKTALGAEQSVNWRRVETVAQTLDELRSAGYEITALEQSLGSIPLGDYRPPNKLALIVGSEVGGLTAELIRQSDLVLEIPMRGRKESYNVSTAAAMALYSLTSLDKQDT